MKKLMMLMGLMALACMTMLAADVTGKWMSEATGKGGPQTYDLKQDGNKLTGSVEGGRGGPVQISNGMVDGDKVSFEVTREMNGNSMTTKYSGTVSGSTMKLTVETARGNREITLTKQ
jgi:opacity protein-like surface antigen